MCKFLVWEDAFKYYAESYYAGHVHSTNSLIDKTVRRARLSNHHQLHAGSSSGNPPGAPGAAASPILVPSSAATPTASHDAVPVTPTRPRDAPGTEVNPIFVPSAAPTPQFRTQPGGVRAHIRQDPQSREHRLAVIKEALAVDNDLKGKKRFIITDDLDTDENTIKGYFGVVQQNKSAGPSRSG